LHSVIDSAFGSYAIQFYAVTVFSESAEYYELVYRWKDYRGEHEKLQKLFSGHVPGGRTLLDIACSTVANIVRFRTGYQIAGDHLTEQYKSGPALN
jgi:hypothetical protein